MLDVDGTLAPIVARPELAEVPAATRATLGVLAQEYLLVACVSGRAGVDAHRLVGVDGVRYVGNHGLELHPDALQAAAAIQEFRRDIAGQWSVEDKGLSLSLHFREEADEQRARAVLEPIALAAREHGLDPRWGRKVLEIRPRINADKGTAVAELVESEGVRHALYAGDDTTDLDAFRAIDSAGLDTGVCIAVDSTEAPAALLNVADVVVSSPAALAALLEWLSSR